MRRVTILAALLAGCPSHARAPARPIEPPALPGLRWTTPMRPWRLPTDVFAFAVDGDTAMLGGRDGWLSRIDLRTGWVTAQRQLPRFYPHGLAAVGRGRWVMVGS